MTRLMRRAAWTLLLAGALWAGSPAGTLNGYITDPSGAVVPGVQVVARNIDTGATRSTQSASGGGYEFPQIEPGAWEVTPTLAPFRPVPYRVVIEVDQTTRLDVSLQVVSSDFVQVDATTPLVEPDKTPLGNVIDARAISSLPLNARQFLDLALLTPGAIPAPPGTQGVGFNMAGARSQSNAYLLDGIANQDTQNNGALNAFRITDAVEEFDVQTGGETSDFGRGSGAQINVVTKSGTNAFHGSAFEYLRNTDLDAADFFTNKLGGVKNTVQRNEFGATLGGAIVKDKTFFFASYEGFRQVAPQVVATRVPSDAERATVTDPVALKLLSFWPEATGTGSLNYTANVPSRDSDDTGFIRVDHSFTPRDKLTARWIEYRGYSLVAGPTPLSGGNSGSPVQRSGMLDESHVFSQRWLNDLRLGYSSNLQERQVQDANVNASTIIPGAVDSSKDPLDAGLPSITISGGYAALGANQNFPQGRFTNTVELSESMSLQAPFGDSRHVLKWGFHVRREDLRQYLDRSMRGVINFAAFTDFAKGQINTASFRTGDTLTHWRRDPWDLFVQDEFRARRDLTLNFGLRYEYPSASAERDGLAANFVQGVGPVLVGTNQELTIAPPVTGAAVGAASIGRTQAPFALTPSGVNPDKNNFAPMFGFAYSPKTSWTNAGGEGDTVIRGGFRVSYDESFNNLLTGLSLSPPFNLQTTQTAGTTQPGKFGWGVAFNQNVPLISNYGKQGPGTPTVGTILFQGIDPNIRSAYAYQFNLGVQRRLGRSTSVEADYQGSLGRRLGMYVDVNQPTVIVRDPTKRGPVAPNEQVFPYPQWNQAQIAKSIGNSSYNALVLTAKHKGKGGTFAQGSYTFGKSLDYNSSYFGSGSQPGETGAPIDSRNIRLDHGPSSFDVRHRLVALYGATLPGRVELSGIVVAQSGMPFTVVSGSPDSNGFNQSNAGVSPSAGNRPNLVKAGPLPQDNGNPDAAFDTSWFGSALAGQVGTSGRNAYRGPGLVNFDVSAARAVRIRERVEIKLRGDFFNVFNHTNFANPVSDMSNANFGKIVQTLGTAAGNAIGTSGGAAGGARLIQFSARLSF